MSYFLVVAFGHWLPLSFVSYCKNTCHICNCHMGFAWWELLKRQINSELCFFCIVFNLTIGHQAIGRRPPQLYWTDSGHSVTNATQMQTGAAELEWWSGLAQWIWSLLILHLTPLKDLKIHLIRNHTRMLLLREYYANNLWRLGLCSKVTDRLWRFTLLDACVFHHNYVMILISYTFTTFATE